ncbi:hypothetical protein BGZ95_002055, partial [Linnemannia exigua]
MQSIASSNAVNLSASTPCDADHASSSTNNNTFNDKYELNSTTSSPDFKQELFESTDNATIQAQDSSALEKGTTYANAPLRPDQQALDNNQVPLMDVGKKPFLYGLRTHKHYITLTILLALFTDMVSYGIIIPIMPSIIEHMG